MMNYDDILCVIPARGGSKGIPRKNLQNLAGIPLFVHSIQHALRAGIPNLNIVVSSDDDEILSVAAKHHVMAHRRPNNISQDLSSTEECLIDAVQVCKTKKTLICLQPTSPIRFPTLISDCLQAYYDGGYDSLHTATKFYDLFWFKPYNDGKWYSSYAPKERLMRQKMPESSLKYFENGNLYIMDIDVLLKDKCRHGKKVCVYPISELEAIQIDTSDDLEKVRMIFKGLSNSRMLKS